MRSWPPFLWFFAKQLPSVWAIFTLGYGQALALPKRCDGILFELSGKYLVSMHFFRKDNRLSAPEQKAVDQEVRSAWEFLREYHAAAGSSGTVPFGIEGVEVRPIDEAPGKREFSVQDGKIIIGLKKDLFGNYRTHTPQGIRDKWEKGEQFPRLSLLKPDPMKRMWPFVNPTGRFRRELKGLVAGLQGQAVARLLAADFVELKALANGKLNGKSPEEIEAIRKEWVKEAKQIEVVDGVVNVATQKIAHDQMPNYDLNLSSYGVTVGNLHDIQIGIKTGNEDVVSSGDRPTVKVNSKGSLVNVFTIDRIHIQLDLSGAVERLSLSRALSSIGSVTDPRSP